MDYQTLFSKYLLEYNLPQIYKQQHLSVNVDREAEVAVKKILTPIDRSRYKEKILAYALSLGKAWGAEVTVIHVIDPEYLAVE